MNNNPDKHTLLESVARYVIASYELAEIIYTSHIFGYPGTLAREINVHLENNIRSLEMLREDDGINDSETSASLSKILDALRLMLENDKHMKGWVENFTGKPMGKIRKTTELSIQKQDPKGGFTGKSSLPFWTSDANYQALMEKSTSLVNDLLDQIGIFFNRVSSISNGFVRNWAEEQRTKGRFNYAN